MKILAFLTLLIASANMAAQAPIDMTAAVDHLDLARYSGQWHEVARLPMVFEKHCASDVTANYTILADGKIEVRNTCRTKQGEVKQSIGAAKPVSGKPGELKVRFAPRWLSLLPVVWADYWVIALDPDYRWAVVGGPSKKYLWLLSREPTLDPARRETLVAAASKAGYPTDKLVWSATATKD